MIKPCTSIDWTCILSSSSLSEFIFYNGQCTRGMSYSNLILKQWPLWRWGSLSWMSCRKTPAQASKIARIDLGKLSYTLDLLLFHWSSPIVSWVLVYPRQPIRWILGRLLLFVLSWTINQPVLYGLHWTSKWMDCLSVWLTEAISNLDPSSPLI